MRQYLILLILYFLTHSLSGQERERKVLFIGIDGCRSDALIAANTPNLDNLFRNGLYTFTSWHLGITVSGPSWSDMLTGVWEDKHGVTNNEYTNSNYDDYPYFVTRVREHRPDVRAIQVTSWAPMSDRVYNDGWDEKYKRNSDNGCVILGREILSTDDELDILFVHIDDVDAIGHTALVGGFNPNNFLYLQQIETVDNQVGQLIEALESRPNYANEDWLVLLTTDHGGIGNSHGGNSRQEKEIWWAARGSTVINGAVIIDINDPRQWEDTPLLTDIAVTAIDHLLPDVDPELVPEWDLDGRSWLDRQPTVPTPAENNVLARYIQVTPNPSSGSFQLILEIPNGHSWDISITDLAGKVIYFGSSMSRFNRIDLPEHIAKGAYNLRVQDSSTGQQGSRLIVIQ